MKAWRVQVLLPPHDLLNATLPEDDGPFEVPGLPRGRLLVRVEAPGCVDFTTTVEASRLDEPLLVALHRGSLVRVQVVKPDSRPATEADLALVTADGSPSEISFDEIRPGVYEARLPSGRWRLTAACEGLRAEETVDLTEGATEEFTLRLAR